MFRDGNFSANGKLSNGTNGQATPNKLINLPGYYISPLLADKNNTRDERIAAMIQTAKSYLGTTYRACWAGAPGTYCDCSGLVMQSLYAAGYDPHPISPKRHALPAYEYESRNFWSDSRIPTIPARERQPGDLVFYHNGYGTVIHIAIYIGDNKVIEEWPPYCMIKPVDWSIRPYVLGYKRVF